MSEAFNVLYKSLNDKVSSKSDILHDVHAKSNLDGKSLFLLSLL